MKTAYVPIFVTLFAFFAPLSLWANSHHPIASCFDQGLTRGEFVLEFVRPATDASTIAVLDEVDRLGLTVHERVYPYLWEVGVPFRQNQSNEARQIWTSNIMRSLSKLMKAGVLKNVVCNSRR